MAPATKSDAPARPRTDTGTEGPIAAWYARQYARQSLSEIEDIKVVARRMAPHIGATSQVLEVAPGPGYLAIEIVRLTGCHLMGIDISETFVRSAAENARRAGLDIAFQRGDAADLPFPGDQFDVVLCRAALKNFARPLAALNEMHRVLKPGGVALVIDLRKDFSPQAVDDYVRGRGTIAATMIRLTFNTMLKKRAYTQEAVADLVAQSHFRHGDIRLAPSCSSCGYTNKLLRSE